MLYTQEYTQVGFACRKYDGENYYVILFANNDIDEDGAPDLPNVDLSELKNAFDLCDHDGSQKIRIQECIEGMKSVNFDKTNPVLYDIIYRIILSIIFFICKLFCLKWEIFCLNILFL